MDTHLLAAADVWEMVIGAIFFILWTVGQLMGGREEAKRKVKPKRPKPQQPVAPQPGEWAGAGKPEAQPAAPRNQEEALRSEVEDFLRRAQGKPAQPKTTRPKPAPQPPVESEVARPVVVRTQQRAKPTPQPPRRQPLAQPITPELRREGVAEHVTRHLDTKDIAEHSGALGAELGQTDERLESRLHEKFDHDLGSLEPLEDQDEAKLKRPDVAADIAAMLCSPDGVRQLIVANEILRRPQW